MQKLIPRKTMENDPIKDNLLQVLSDKYCRSIIETTMYQYKSASQISNDAGIPISTVYRRLQSLIDNKALRVKGTISEEGKKTFLYKSRIKSILTAFDGANIEVQIIPNSKGNGQNN